MKVFSIHVGASTCILDPQLFAFYSPQRTTKSCWSNKAEFIKYIGACENTILIYIIA